MRIVIVDDNELNLKRCQALLEPLGYEVVLFTGAEPALQLLKTHPVNLILVDLAMPIHSGYDLMAAMKREKITTKIIVVSGKNKDEDIKKAISMGALDYILKPYDDDFFVAKVKMMLEKDMGTSFQFAEAIYDKASHLKLSFPQMHVSETGFYFDSPIKFPQGMVLDLKTELFDELRLGDMRFKVTTTTEVTDSKSDEPVYRTYVSFIGLSQAQLADVRVWVRQQQIKYRKA